MWIVLAVVAVAVPSLGYGVYSFMTSGAAATGSSEAPRRVGSLLSEPTAIRAAVQAELGDEWMPFARMLTIERNTAELLLENADGLARRYWIYADGRVRRRGVVGLVAAEPFDLRQLALDRLPDMIEEARGITGHSPQRVIVGRDEEGTLLWRVVPAGGSADTYFTADGTHIPDPDAI